MTAPLDLADIARWVSRPGATPAPTAAGPGDPPQMPTGPWHPRTTEKACGCGVLDGEDCDCQTFTAQAMAAFRRPIFFDYRKPEAA